MADILHRLMTETWPAKMEQSALSALMAPGNAYKSTWDNPVTPEEMIAPAADLAGLIMGVPGVAKAIEPITSYPSTYNDMRQEAQGQMARGIEQVGRAVSGEDLMGYPVDSRTWEAAKGVANSALGALGYVASPVNAAIRTVVGEPIEENAGIPKEYSEFAASMALPGMGLTKINAVEKAVPAAVKAGEEVAQAAGRLSQSGAPVQVTRALASDVPGVQQAATGMKNVPFAGTPLLEANYNTVRQLGAKADEIAGGLGSAERFAAGDSAKASIINYITGKSAERASKLYDAVDNLVDQSKKVPLEITKAVADEIKVLRGAAGLSENSKAVDIILEAATRPDGVTYQGLKQLRTAVGEQLKSGILPEGMSQWELKRIYGALSDDLKVTVAVAGGEKASQAFDRANRYYRLISDRRTELAKIVGANGDAPAERVFDRLVTMASGKGRSDIEGLTKARKAIGPDDWGEFVSGVISRLGRDAEGNFSPDRFSTAYGNLSQSGKGILFGAVGDGSVLRSLNDIALISERIKSRYKMFDNPSGTARNASFAGMGYSAALDPVSTISAVVGGSLVSRVLSQPAAAASAAQFARKLEIAIQKPTPATYAGLLIASRNLANTVNAEFGLSTRGSDFLKAIQGPVKSPADNEEPKPEGVINR